MRIPTMAAALLLLGVTAFGQMPDPPAKPCADCNPKAASEMGGMDSPMPPMMNLDLRAACRVDLGSLGLADEARKALEAERFELQKLVIRNRAELKILGMELEQSLATREFDLEAAGKKLDKIASTENKIRESHLKFLRSLASKLDDKGWEALRAEAKPMPGAMSAEMMRDRMMPGMMQGMMQGGMMPAMKEAMMPCGCGKPCGCCGEPCDGKPCGKMPCDKMQGGMMNDDKMPCDKMQGAMMRESGMMQGGKMPCGMMPGEMKEGIAPAAEPGAGAHEGHHPAEAPSAGDAKAADEFFKDK